MERRHFTLWKGKKFILPLAIFFLAFLLRIYNVSSFPPSLNWDEISHGYNAYSILKTGKDEWGETFPTIFRAYGDYKLPVYIYLTTASEAILGLSALAVRLPSALAGSLTVLFTFLIAKELFEDRRIAVLSSLLVAIEPWNLFLSRIAVEANLALFFIVAGVFFFLKALSRNSRYLLLSAIFLGLSVWTYNSARIFTPLLLLSLVAIYRKELKSVYKKQRNDLLNSVVITIFFMTPMFIQLLGSSGQARYGWVKILDEGTISRIIEARATTELSPILARALHNKATYLIGNFVTGYFSHFNPRFLFLSGGTHYQFNIPGKGLLYLVNLPLFAVGAIYVIKNIKKKSNQFLLAWLLFAPVASGLTREAPHALRSITMLPVPMIFSGIGGITIYDWLKNQKKIIRAALLGIYFIALIISLKSYIKSYKFDYAQQYSWVWQYGHQQLVDYIKPQYEEYDAVIITKKYGEPHEFVLFYWPWNPEAYRNDPNLIRFEQSNWYWVDAFDKFYFVNDWEISETGDEFILESDKLVDCTNIRCLLVTSPESAKTDWNQVQKIDFLDGQPAFLIYENTED